MPITFPNETAEYRQARQRLLDSEAELRRSMEAVAEQRRALPRGGEPPEDYAFDGLDVDGQPTKVRLSELFRSGTDQLLIYQMMFPRYSADDREDAKHGRTARLPHVDQPCPSCTAELDQLDRAVPHFEAGGASFAVIAKTAIENLAGLAKDRGWSNLRVLSAANNRYLEDYRTIDDQGEPVQRVTAFVRDSDGAIRHAWSSELDGVKKEPGQDARAFGTIELFWNMFDLMPKGRPQKFHEQLQYDCCGSRPRARR